jgi:hypothetical protein
VIKKTNDRKHRSIPRFHWLQRIPVPQFGHAQRRQTSGTALFARLHETLIPVLYTPTNMGQITLTDLFGNYAAPVAVLAMGFGLCAWGIGKL